MNYDPFSQSRSSFDVVSITLGNWIKTSTEWRSSAEKRLGECCMGGAALQCRIGAGNGDSWYHMCAFNFHFWGRKVKIRLRMCGPPLFQLYMRLWLLILRFWVSFLVPPDGPKNGTVKVLFLCSFTKLCMRSQMGPVGGLIFGTVGPVGGLIFGTVFRFIFWSFLYQGCRSAMFGFQWSFVAYGDWKDN